MKVVLNVVSTQRSGHHAFIEWFCHHSPRSWTLHNNVPTIRLLRTSLPAAAGSSDGAGHIFNFEGIGPGPISTVEARAADLSLEPRRIVFLRHPLNVLAGLTHRAIRTGRSRFDMATQIARSVNAQIAWMKIWGPDAPGLSLSYDHWIADDAYRRLVAEKLDLQGHDLLTKVADYGRGSSFTEYAEAPDPAALLDRWSGLKDLPEFRAVVSHEKFRDHLIAICDGGRPDSLGRDFANPEGARWLRSLPKTRPAPRDIDRYLDSLEPGTGALAVLERHSGWQRQCLKAFYRLDLALNAKRRPGRS